MQPMMRLLVTVMFVHCIRRRPRLDLRLSRKCWAVNEGRDGWWDWSELFSFPVCWACVLDPRVEVLMARASHAAHFFWASSSRLASASCAPLMIPVHRAVWFLANISHVSMEMPESLMDTFWLSLYRFIWTKTGTSPWTVHRGIIVLLVDHQTSTARPAHLSWTCCERV